MDTARDTFYAAALNSSTSVVCRKRTLSVAWAGGISTNTKNGNPSRMLFLQDRGKSGAGVGGRE